MLLVVCDASKFALLHLIKDGKDTPSYFDTTFNHIKQKMQHSMQDFPNAKEYTSFTM